MISLVTGINFWDFMNYQWIIVYLQYYLDIFQINKNTFQIMSINVFRNKEAFDTNVEWQHIQSDIKVEC